MERLGVGRRDRGDHADARGERRHPRAATAGVEPTADLVGAVVGAPAGALCRPKASSRSRSRAGHARRVRARSIQ